MITLQFSYHSWPFSGPFEAARRPTTMADAPTLCPSPWFPVHHAAVADDQCRSQDSRRRLASKQAIRQAARCRQPRAITSASRSLTKIQSTSPIPAFSSWPFSCNVGNPARANFDALLQQHPDSDDVCLGGERVTRGHHAAQAALTAIVTSALASVDTVSFRCRRSRIKRTASRFVSAFNHLDSALFLTRCRCSMANSHTRRAGHDEGSHGWDRKAHHHTLAVIMRSFVVTGGSWHQFRMHNSKELKMFNNYSLHDNV